MGQSESLFPIVADRVTTRLLEHQYVEMFQGENPLYKQATSTFCNPTFKEYAKN